MDALAVRELEKVAGHVPICPNIHALEEIRPGLEWKWLGHGSREVATSHYQSRTPQSAHHPHKSHDEHRQCNPGGSVHFALLLGFDNLYTTPSKIPLLD